VSKLDNRFSETKNPVYTATGNKISDKCVGGGICVADTGIYIDPIVEKNAANGQIVLLGFHIMNRTSHNSMWGDANELGLILEMIFRLPDGQIINLKASNQKNSSGSASYNPIGGFASYEKNENGIVEISKDSFKKLVSDQKLSLKISGSTHSVIYEEDEIDSEFLINLKKFYESYVK
jgi:hypothetical protein